MAAPSVLYLSTVAPVYVAPVYVALVYVALVCVVPLHVVPVLFYRSGLTLMFIYP
ncbi:MAG: hypothetical protein OIF57_10120 [Marinobacterium sp.]|nr:hypothetical protein [Marinobacterium sp.]